MTTLLDPISLGGKTLKNRVIMAPLTRGRAGAEGVPSDLVAEYYRQRAGAGLIIAEATAISAEGRGWMNSPGLYTEEQQLGWKAVADAVHGEGGSIFVQLWHMGATVHPDFVGGEQPVSASTVALSGQLTTPFGRDRAFVAPRALSVSEIAERVEDFAKAARRAIDAGLDGVEIHGANGFLIDQFTRDSTNKRDDEYGGSIDNRLRFMMEVVKAVSLEVGADKVGVRLSPTNSVWGISDSEYNRTFTRAAEKLNEAGVAYLHLLEPHPDTGHAMASDAYLTPAMRECFTGVFLVNGGYDQASGEMAVKQGSADAVVYGQAFIANPDLPARFKAGAPLAEADSSTFYSDGASGYVDYQPLAG